MARLTGFLAVAAIVGLTVSSVSAQTLLQGQQARLNFGSIQGVVSDERGGPLPGALVSALGATMSLATTDARGRFVIQPLAAGDYVLRVHLAGFVAGRRDGVRVGPSAVDVAKIQLHRIDGRQRAAHGAADSHRRRLAPAGRQCHRGRRQPFRDRLAASPHQAQRAEAGRRRRVDCRCRRRAARAAGEPVDLQSRVRQRRGFANMAASFFTATPVLG